MYGTVSLKGGRVRKGADVNNLGNKQRLQD